MRRTDNLTDILDRQQCSVLSLNAAIALLGGASALADALKLNRKTIYNWSRLGRVPIEPVNYALAVERLTKLPRWFLRPDIYDWPRGAAVVTPLGTFQLSEQHQ